MTVPVDTWRDPRWPWGVAWMSLKLDHFAVAILGQLRNARWHGPRWGLIPRKFTTEDAENHGEPRRTTSILVNSETQKTAQTPKRERKSLLRGPPWFSASSVVKTLRAVNKLGVGDFPRRLRRYRDLPIAMPFNV